ncbi:MAG: fibronectin type III domain-containing protein [Nocardioides sp.]
MTRLRPRARTSTRALAALLGVCAMATTPLVVPASATASAPPSAIAADDATIASADPLLDEPQNGRRAITKLGDQLPLAAARNDIRPQELRSLLRSDQTAWVDQTGAIRYVEPALDPGAGDRAAGAGQLAPLDETFVLHSNPGADLTILLDFDGAAVTGTAWNDADGVTPGTHPAWDPAGDGSSFSDSERIQIQQIWSMVAEDFAPFEVDVTTEDPGQAGIERSSSGDAVYGTRVLISPSDDAHLKICNRSCGGVAYLSVFDGVGSYYQPAWVFPQALAHGSKYIAEAATHEAGHNLGLNHDGTASLGYYEGHGIWAPIMGVGYSRPLTQWSKGSYVGANNHQDDLAILTGYLGARPDEASGLTTAPSPLPEGGAVVGSAGDVDSYLLGDCPSGAEVAVLPARTAPNLDVRAILFDAAGTQRAVSQPTSGVGDGTTASGVGATLNVPAAGAGWVVTVEGASQGTWASEGYDDYGSLGAYTVSAPGCDGEHATGVPGSPTAVAGTADGGDRLTLSWSAPDSEGDAPITGYVVARSGSAVVEAVAAEARSHTFTGLEAGATYELSVRAVNAVGAGQAVTVTATTTPPPPTAPSAPRTVTGSYDQQVEQINVWWTEPASTGTAPITGYAIYFDGAMLGQMGEASRGAVITPSASGFSAGPHVIGVAAVNEVGSSPVSTVTVDVVHPDRPANDDVGQAVVLTGSNGSVDGDNTYATAEATDPTPPSSYGAGGYSVWYAWTPAADGTVTVSTSGGVTGRDTTLASYTGSPGDLVQVAGSDDAIDFHASISFPAQAGTRYLLAVDGFGFVNGTGPFTLTWNQVVPAAPSAPEEVGATRGDTAATVTWQAPAPNGAPITSYTATSTPGGHTCTTTDLTCTVTGLTNGTPYTFTVTATNAIGTSNPSHPTDQITPAGTPGKVAKPTAKISGRKVVISWKQPAANGDRITSYRITGGKPKSKVVAGSKRKLVLKKLKPGTYVFRVQAKNGVGWSTPSAKVTVRVRR